MSANTNTYEWNTIHSTVFFTQITLPAGQKEEKKKTHLAVLVCIVDGNTSPHQVAVHRLANWNWNFMIMIKVIFEFD